MVKRLVFILLILPCLFCLTTCDLFVALLSLSPFPGYLSQAVASVDMREEVESFLGNDYDHWWYDVFVLEDYSSGAQGVFLVVQKNTGGQWVYAFNTSLELKDKAFRSDYSDTHLLDQYIAPSRFIVGNIAFDPASLASIGEVWTNAGRFAFSNGSYNFGLHSYYDGISIFEYVLEIRYFGGWPLDDANKYARIIRIGDNLELRGLGYDPVADMTYLFFYRWESERLRVAAIPGATFNPAPGVADDILNIYPASPDIDFRRGEYFQYTRKGLIGEANQRGFFVRFNLAGDKVQQFYVGVDDHQGIDFDINGEYYYVFDRNTFRLYKAKTGF
jgi:hypothetical protein